MDDIVAALNLARDQRQPDADRRQLARAAAAGSQVRLARGAYLSVDDWQSYAARSRYLARILATATTLRSRPVFSHQSAAAIWGLPNIVPWPLNVEVTVNPRTASRSRSGIERHAAVIPDEDVVEVAGIYVTSLSRTLLDVAASARFIDAVAMADYALHVDRFGRKPPLATREMLDQAWERATPMRAHSRVRAVLAFAETHADSPLESVSRVNMRLIGVPKPQL